MKQMYSRVSHGVVFCSGCGVDRDDRSCITDASSAPCCSVHTGFTGWLNEIECGCWIAGRGELLSAVPMCIVVRGRLSQLASRSLATLYSYLTIVTHKKHNNKDRFQFCLTVLYLFQRLTTNGSHLSTCGLACPPLVTGQFRRIRPSASDWFQCTLTSVKN